MPNTCQHSKKVSLQIDGGKRPMWHYPTPLAFAFVKLKSVRPLVAQVAPKDTPLYCQTGMCSPYYP